MEKDQRMGPKKPRNADGTKKKKVVDVGGTAEVFEKDYLWQLQMAGGINHEGLYYCGYCDIQIPLNAKNLKGHYISSVHVKNFTIHNLLPSLVRYGMDWLPGERKFFCSDCHVVLEARAKSLLQHVEKHGKIAQAITTGGEEDFGSNFPMIKVLKSRLWKVDLKSTNACLNLQMRTYDRLLGPFILRDDSPANSFLASLRNDVFTKADLAFIIELTSFLVSKDNNVDRSEAMQSSKIKAFGMRWARGDTGWYKHQKIDVYKVSEELASFVSDRLQIYYPGVFQHLEKIVEVKGFRVADVSIGKSPFTTFAVTEDYNCRPHVDEDDYDLGFIVWLKQDHVEVEEEVSLFAFPELKVGFVPNHGDVLCFRARELHHCTRAFRKKGMLGLAFFQKASLFRQLRKLLDVPFDGVLQHIRHTKNSPPKTIFEKRMDFEIKKATYKKELQEGRVSFIDI